MLAREINIRGCEDYKNTFARMESDCTFRFGFKALIKSISFTKQSNLTLSERNAFYSGFPKETPELKFRLGFFFFFFFFFVQPQFAIL